MNDGLAMLEGKTPREIAERSAGNLLPMPWIEPEDVAAAVVFLASSKARVDHRLGIRPRRGAAHALRGPRAVRAPNGWLAYMISASRAGWGLDPP